MLEATHIASIHVFLSYFHEHLKIDLDKSSEKFKSNQFKTSIIQNR